MGVIRNINTVPHPYDSNYEDFLDEIINGDHQTDHDVPIRRQRRSRRHRQDQQPLRPEHTMPLHFLAHRHRSGKKFQRLQNTTFLMSLTDNSPVAQEVTIEDFMSPQESVFSQLIHEMESMEAWNDFVNQGMESTNGADAANNPAANEADKRAHFPAYSPESCFRKIDSSLRSLLRHQHVPLGKLSRIEEQLSEFFQTFPDQVFKSVQPSSYERLLLHALSQYLDLCSQSYNQDGKRWTKVRNSQSQFILPAMMLSAFLENRFRNNL